MTSQNRSETTGILYRALRRLPTGIKGLMKSCAVSTLPLTLVEFEIAQGTYRYGALLLALAIISVGIGGLYVEAEPAEEAAHAAREAAKSLVEEGREALNEDLVQATAPTAGSTGLAPEERVGGPTVVTEGVAEE